MATTIDATLIMPPKTRVEMANMPPLEKDEIRLVKDEGFIQGDGVNTGDLLPLIAGGAMTGTNYVFVQGRGTPEQNAAELQSAYGKAKTMNPSVSNRITIVVAPGYYRGSGSVTELIIDTDYIDIVSLTGNRDIKVNNLMLIINASKIFIKGVSTGSNMLKQGAGSAHCKYENCDGFDENGFYLGTFYNCLLHSSDVMYFTGDKTRLINCEIYGVPYSDFWQGLIYNCIVTNGDLLNIVNYQQE